MNALPPGLQGWVMADQANQQRQASELQQVQGVMQLQGLLAKRQQEQAFRGRLANAKTPEEKMAVAVDFMGPEAYAKMQQGSWDKQAQIRSTNEATMARLAQAAQQYEATYQARIRTAKTAEERLALDRDREAFKQSIQSEAARRGGAEANYNFGFSPNIPQPTVTAAPLAAAPPPNGLAGILSGRPQDEQAAISAIYQAGDAPMSVTLPPKSGLGGMLSPAPAAPRPAPPPLGNEDMHDRRAASVGITPAATPIPAAAVTAPKPEMVMPPEIASAPARVQNQWRLAQQKAAMKANVTLAGGRESVYIQRMTMGANQAAKDLANVVQLPLTASTGIFGGRKQGAGLMDATMEVLANKATQQEAQAYNAMATGFQRSLAQIESAGLMPSGSLTHQMDAVLFKEGDTNLTKLHKLAQTRQIIEAGMEVINANPRVSEPEKEKVQSILTSIRKSVPFTHQDLIRLSEEHKTNPNASLKDVVGNPPKNTGGWSIRPK